MNQTNNNNTNCAGCGKPCESGGQCAGNTECGCGGCSGGSCAGGSCAGGGCASGGGGCPRRDIVITESERDFLLLMGQLPFLPLASIIKDSAAEGTEPESPEPLYLDSPEDSIETIREKANLLLSLQQKRLITLDYDIPLTNGDYMMYEKSGAVKSLRGGSALQLGSIGLTALGRSALDSLDALA